VNSRKKKIWLDLPNSPHVPFFIPIIKELNKRRYTVMLTARDCFQVCGLADLFNLRYKRIGRHYGKRKILKVIGMFIRAIQLAPMVIREKPDLAMSHGSREQIVLGAILGIPTVAITDYEHSTFLPIIKLKWLIIPEVIPNDTLKKKVGKILKYPGIKEDVYINNFKPDPAIRDELGIHNNDLLVTIRPPATEAHYHNHHSDELFECAINYLGNQKNIRIVLLARNEKQSALIRKMWPGMCSNSKILILDHVVDGLNLIWHSDLVVSGGGTMNRESAALEVPVYSIFRGKIGAVDQYLADSGRLTLLESVEDVRNKIILEHRHRPEKHEYGNSAALQRIIENIVTVLDS
jgi:predicted glycosyltransferase